MLPPMKRLLLAALLVSFIRCVSGVTHHVSVAKGNDAGDGSEGRPWRSFEKISDRIQPGDTVIVHGGIYRADRFEFGPAGKDAGHRTVMRAVPGERVLLARADGTPPGFWMDDYMRVEGFWMGGKWTKEEKQPTCAVGGSPIGRGKQFVGCTVFGYTSGVLVGSSEDLLIQGCRVVHCGSGRFSHGCYLSGGYDKGAMTQHVILDDNTFVAGEGYAIHGWHEPHSCIFTRNFVSGYFWDLVLSGSDHLVAHNTLWRNTGQQGREPGWNAWFDADRVVFVNNILNSAIPIFDHPGKGSTISHNAYLSAAPHKEDAQPFDLRKRDAAVEAWVKRIDTAVAEISAAFDEPVEKIHRNGSIEKNFTALREPSPESNGLRGNGLGIGLLPGGKKPDLGRAVAAPLAFWDAFHRLQLGDFDNRGQPIGKRSP